MSGNNTNLERSCISIVTPSISRNAGGLFDAVRGLTLKLSTVGIDVAVYSLEDQHTAVDLYAWSSVNLTISKVVGPKSIGFSPSMRRSLLYSRTDLVHTHGIWMHPSSDVVAWAKHWKRPYIVSPHGMLNKWILSRSTLRKKIALSMYEKTHLQGATCFHALSIEEARGIRAAGFRQPIAIVPNGVNEPNYGNVKKPNWWKEELENKRLLLYFGRLHPVKGVENLLTAWNYLVNAGYIGNDLALIIAGWGDERYVNTLKKLVSSAAAHQSIYFIGPQYGDEKNDTYAACNCVVLPSYSEGLPMVPLEAWAMGLPCAITPACNLKEGVESGAAFEIESTFEGLIKFLTKFSTMNDMELKHIGMQGKALVQGQFTWLSIAEKMANVYRWILGAGDRPWYVYDEID